MKAGWLFLKATFFKLLQSCRKLIGPLNKGYVGIEEVVLVVKNLSANAEVIRDVGSIPGSGSSPRVGNGSQLQYSCLENPRDRGAWRATVHGVAKSQTQLSF